MRTISRKGEIQSELESCKQVFNVEKIDLFINAVHDRILLHKVKFPLLEYCAEEIFDLLPSDLHISFCDAVEKRKTVGGNVFLGKILQLRLPQYFNQSLDNATKYISNADIWYVCDIIGERVFGYALLHHPVKMLPKYKKLSSHSANWVIRSLGAGGHYAIKKGLPKMEVRQLFEVLLTIANSNDKEIRQGVGWAAKTTAKFHPDLIAHFQADIENTDKVANWFRKKIEIGLNRNRYASRN